MGTFQRTAPPALPVAPREYNQKYVNELNNILRLYFSALQGTQGLSAATLSFDLNTLPTEADVATLRAGDVYRDTTASNVLKVKV